MKDQVSKTIHLQGTFKAGLYTFVTPKSSPSAFAMANSTTSTAQEAIRHAQLGHPTAPVLYRALSSCNLAIVISCNKLSELCVHCLLAKSHKLPFPFSFSHALNFCILTCGVLHHVQPLIEQDMFF